MKTLLTLCLALLTITTQAATVRYAATNVFGEADTNTIRLTPIGAPIRADGSFVTRGSPFSMRVTNGVAITNLGTGNWMVTNSFLRTNILFAVPEDTSTNIYEMADLAISGFNTYNYTPGVRSITPGSGIGISATTGNIVISATNPPSSDLSASTNLPYTGLAAAARTQIETNAAWQAYLATNNFVSGTTYSNLSETAYTVTVRSNLTAHTVTDKNNVKFWGAVGDGVTDDTVAIQAALDSVPEQAVGAWIYSPRGSEIVMPAGNYVISNTLTMKRGTRLSGAGKESTIITSVQTSGDVLFYMRPTNAMSTEPLIGIRDLTIAIDNAVTHTNGAGIHITSATTNNSDGPGVQIELDNVVVYRTFEGYRLRHVLGGTIKGCRAFTCGDSGFIFRGFQTLMTVESCWASQCGNDGWDIVGPSYCRFVACGSDSNGNYGWNIHAIAGHQSANGNAFQIGSEWSRVLFHFQDLGGGNTATLLGIASQTTNTYTGLELDNVHGMTITPYITGTATNAGYAILMEANCSGVVFIGGDWSAFGGGGLLMSGRTDMATVIGSVQVNSNSVFPQTVVVNRNMGIGTNAPDEKLHVVGTVKATAFAGAGGGVTLTASGFDGNLAVTDDTLQEVAQKVDDLALGAFNIITNGNASDSSRTVWLSTNSTPTLALPNGSIATTTNGALYIRTNGAWSIFAGGGGGDALVANPLSQFAATTSSQLRSVLSDEDGTGVFLTANGSGASLTAIGSAALATDAVSADELNAAGVEAELEAVLDLPDLQGAVTDAQVPNTITIDLATVATTANAGDSATSFFSSGTVEAARLGSGTTDGTTWLRGDGTWQSTNIFGGSGSQTPYTTDHNAAGKSITNVNNLEVTNELQVATVVVSNLVGKTESGSLTNGAGIPVAFMSDTTNTAQNISLLRSNAAGVNWTNAGTLWLKNSSFVIQRADATAQMTVTLNAGTTINNGLDVVGGGISTDTGFTGDGSGLTGLNSTNLVGNIDDARIPDNITVTYAANAGQAQTGDSATAFFSSGTIEPAYLDTNSILANLVRTNENRDLYWTNTLILTNGVNAELFLKKTGAGVGFDSPGQRLLAVSSTGQVGTPSWADLVRIDGEGLTNMLFVPVVIAGTSVTVATNTIAATGQKTYTVSSTAGGGDVTTAQLAHATNNLNAAALTTNTVPDARIGAAIARLASPTFTGTVTLPSGQALIAPALGTIASGNGVALAGVVHTNTGGITVKSGWNLLTPTSGSLLSMGDEFQITGTNVMFSNDGGNTEAFSIGGGVITLPAQATPTTDADGEIALDTDGWGTGFDAYEVFNGTASAYLVATTASDTPSNGQVPKWNTGGSITWENDNSSGSQTPWTSTIDANSNPLVGVNAISGTNNSLLLQSEAAAPQSLVYFYQNLRSEFSAPTYGWNFNGGTAGITMSNLQLSPITGTGSYLTLSNTYVVATNLPDFNTTTATLTNKTIDFAGVGNVVKLKGYIYLTHPHLVDGTGATLGTTVTSITYGHATFGNAADKAANYAEYFLQVPEDIDTSVALRARLKVVLGGADTADQNWLVSSVSVADSAVPGSGTLANETALDYTADATGASGDVETTAWTTLTNWAGALTAGQTWRIRLMRDGDTSDASTVNSSELGLVIEYGITQ